MAEKKIVNLEQQNFRGPVEMDLKSGPDSDSKEPFGYSGPGIYPTAKGDELMGRVAEARARAIYEAHGRNANAIARMKLDPSYAYARAAGIQLPGDGMKGTSKSASLAGGQSDELIGGGRRSTRYRDAGAAMRGGGEAKSFSESAYAGPINQTTKGGRIDTARDTRDIPGGMSAPNNPNNQTLDSIPVSPSGSDQGAPPKPISDPTAPATPNSPESPSKPPTVESSKGPRLTTDRSQPSRDEDLGTSRGATRDEDRRIAEISMRPEARDPNASQEKRERAKMDYDNAVQAEARKDTFAKYRTEAGDTEIAQRTGEVQDRSRYGGDRVISRQTYTSKGGKEMIGNQMQRPDGSTYFAGLPSADQNKADAFNRNVGSNFNQYNNFSATPQNYKASAEDMRANYAFGGGSGPGGSLVAQDEAGLTGRNRSELAKDTGSFSAGSNYSGITSRGQQSPNLDKSSGLAMKDILPNDSQSQKNQEFKGPESKEIKKKSEIAKANSKTIATL